MLHGIPSIQGLLRRVCRDQKGITGLETAIVLIAFVVVASVFAYAVITTGLFSSEKAQSSAQSGVTQAKSTAISKGSMILSEALSVTTATGHDGLANAAVLTDTAATFITEGVVVGDAIRNTTDGSSSTITALTATTVTGVLAGGTDNDWDIGDLYEIDMDSVGTIKFKLTPSPGADPVSLATSTTLVTYNDANNNITTTYAAAFPTPLVDPAYWNSAWLLGAGPGVDGGEVVEFTVNIKNLTTPLPANKPFKVEIIPQTGAAIAFNRVTPLEMAKVMDLN